MRPTVRRLAVASAAAYLMAGWLAAALHSHAGHAHAGCHDHAACAPHGPAGHAHCGHDHGAPTDAEGRSDNRPAPAPHDHSGCVVCEFLGQPPLPAEPVRLIDTFGPLLLVAAPTPPALPPVAARTPTARGPPVA